MTPERGALLKPGDIVQIRPDCLTNMAFGACLLVVTELKNFGVQGYVQALGDDRSKNGGQAYIRLKWDEFEPTGGKVEWIVE